MAIFRLAAQRFVVSVLNLGLGPTTVQFDLPGVGPNGVILGFRMVKVSGPATMASCDVREPVGQGARSMLAQANIAVADPVEQTELFRQYNLGAVNNRLDLVLTSDDGTDSTDIDIELLIRPR